MRKLLTNLTPDYKRKRREIKKRLKDFKKLHAAKDKDIFQELCFCILTPQSKAVNCDRAIKKLQKSNILLKGREGDIRNRIKGLVRFHNKKAAYLIEARKELKLNCKNIFKTREWLVENIKGLGYKEASHFLRNIGFGSDIAILDIHILKNLKNFGVIRKIPHSITKKNYINIEDKMRKFAKEVNIPLEELDLLFWSNETGFVFK